MSEDKQICLLLVLGRSEKLLNTVHRLSKGWQLSFACSPSLQSKHVRLFCNYQICTNQHKGVSFNQKGTYAELEWKRNSDLSEGYDCVTSPIDLQRAGSYHYYFTIDKSDSIFHCDGEGYFIVDPELFIGKENKILSMDAIQIQTVMPKLLGTFDEWEHRLLVSRHSGYNMIHFTPIQQLNHLSGSSYSISDQLKINSHFTKSGAPCEYSDISTLVKHMKNEWNVLSLTDMVYNHTASDSAWLIQHPESAFNLDNSPHLKPAFIVDRIIWYTSLDIARGKLEGRGIPALISTETHLHALNTYLAEKFREHKMAEFYTVDIDRSVSAYKAALEGLLTNIDFYNLKPQVEPVPPKDGLEIVQDSKYNRLASYIDLKQAMDYSTENLRFLKSAGASEVEIVDQLTSKYKTKLLHLNQDKMDDLERHLDTALDNVLKAVRYRFVDESGDRFGAVSAENPLVCQYFLHNKPHHKPTCIEQDEEILTEPQTNKFVMAHNGWVMGDDPLKNFAELGSHVYLRRELVCWGDSVKLRYGQSPEDSPYLWQRMEEYTRLTVEIFHGIRLDNCHSTPIHVAEYMIRLARSIRPDLYVVAELFTANEDIDNIFVNKLGLNSLIRESLVAWDPHEQGRLVYKYGGQPVGSFFQPNVRLLKPTVAHALLMDATHDNESIIKKRTVFDALSLSAFVAMACCATGSNRGFDELVPDHIHVVKEDRLYQSWSDKQISDHQSGLCNGTTGIIAAKEALNQLHQMMGEQSYNQIYVHDLGADTISITRHNPNTHNSIICVVRSAFSTAGEDNPHCAPLEFEGCLGEVLLYAHMVPSTSEGTKFINDETFINGLKSHVINMKRNVNISSIPGVQWQQQDNSTKQIIDFHHFTPGSVLIIQALPPPSLTEAVKTIHASVHSIHESLESTANGIRYMMDKLSLADLNIVLYHCSSEEKACTGYDTYEVQSYGKFVYAGLQGVFSPLTQIRSSNELGHALCDNLRQGDWLPSYLSGRLTQYPLLKQFSAYLEECFAPLKELPSFLKPCYFDLILISLSNLIHSSIWSRMSRFVNHGSPYVKTLASSSLQFCGQIKSSQLAPLDPTVEKEYMNPTTNASGLVSISAGLPHFSEGIMRNWGRDTFISLRGLLLVTGRYQEARAIILSFAGTLRHGLIPNLLGEGRHARYNCRDAVWWWLQSVQDYCKMAPNGLNILQDSVTRMYPTDESKALRPGKKMQPLYQVIQEILQRHAQGVSFRERNAGLDLDRDMTSQGFEVQIGIDWKTGFVYGGSEHNCGTWMDKMGSSHQTGNAGKPATPRNGSAVELVGLSASAVRWLATLHKSGKYQYAGVQAKRADWVDEKIIPFEVWYNLIKKNFERYFWLDSTYTTLEPDPRPDLINKRNIYKDSICASPEWSDYQLRPNFPIAMVVAPGLFDPENAWKALDSVEEHLLGPLGMRTLDPTDWGYNGDYINNDESHGFNYHNGPEWVWPVGYFLRAKLVMAQKLQANNPNLIGETIRFTEDKLANHHVAITLSDWRSLPELTNANGKMCADSCPAQAWSIACIMDALYDVCMLKTT